jgi:DNA polymerase I
MSKTLALDFEFSGIVEPRVELVCCTTLDLETLEARDWWLHKDKLAKRKLVAYLQEFDCIMGYSCVAEARSFIALDLEPLSFEWIDLFLEYRMLTNHNDDLQWGDQLVDGKVRKVRKPKPKWERTEEDTATGFKATHSLAEATFKLTGEIRDTAHKNKMRDLIISAPEKYSAADRKSIMEYCSSDVKFLPRIWKRVQEEHISLAPEVTGDRLLEEIKLRGRYSAHTALMETHGYPIDLEKTKNFSSKVGMILADLQREINSLFPDIRPFTWDKKTSKFKWNQKITQDWVAKNHDTKSWIKTDSGKLSLSLEAFEKQYSFRHSYPTDLFGAQLVRFLKLKQSLYGFSDSGGKRKSFWDSVGSDGRVRPYMNHYGAQSSRSQPGSSGFMFLKPAWMRALVTPDKDHFMAGIDYGSQEFFIAALESEDDNMIGAYLSGDPYLHTAKLAGAVPQDGTKEDYKEMRDLFKATVLGISYLMTKYGLAIKLTNDTGRVWTEDQADEQINMFYDAYPDFKTWQDDLQRDYRGGGGIALPCGWKMFSDNENIRSVCNVPIQGFGASVMRLAVDMAVERGCKVLFTLHDAIYIEDSIGNEKKIKVLAECMTEAFTYYFDPSLKKLAAKIKLDPFAWSPAYKKDSELKVSGLVVPCSNLYIDDRAREDYDKFSKYFLNSDSNLL